MYQILGFLNYFHYNNVFLKLYNLKKNGNIYILFFNTLPFLLLYLKLFHFRQPLQKLDCLPEIVSF